MSKESLLAVLKETFTDVDEHREISAVLVHPYRRLDAPHETAEGSFACRHVVDVIYCRSAKDDIAIEVANAMKIVRPFSLPNVDFDGISTTKKVIDKSTAENLIVEHDLREKLGPLGVEDFKINLFEVHEYFSLVCQSEPYMVESLRVAHEFFHSGKDSGDVWLISTMFLDIVKELDMSSFITSRYVIQMAVSSYFCYKVCVHVSFVCSI